MSGRRTRVERSAGGVVVREIGGELHVLLIRDPYRNWGLPKGHVEPGEDDRGAAVREVAEETGLDRLVVGPEVTTIDWSFRLRGRRIHKYCAFFLMASASGRARPERSEGISACRWVRLGDALDTISYDNAREVLVQARRILRREPPAELMKAAAGAE